MLDDFTPSEGNAHGTESSAEVTVVKDGPHAGGPTGPTPAEKKGKSGSPRSSKSQRPQPRDRRRKVTEGGESPMSSLSDEPPLRSQTSRSQSSRPKSSRPQLGEMKR